MASKRKKKHSKENSTRSIVWLYAKEKPMNKATLLAIVARLYHGKKAIAATLCRVDASTYAILLRTPKLPVGSATDSWVEISMPMRSGSKKSTEWVFYKSWTKKSKKSSRTSHIPNSLKNTQKN